MLPCGSSSSHAEGPLARWLGKLTLAHFLGHHFGRAPLAQKGTGLPDLGACTWQSLGKILASSPAPDVLVVAGGAALPVAAPRSLEDLEALFSHRVGIVVRTPMPQCSVLAALCENFSRELSGEQRVLLFATPAGRHGFGWHYDVEDVFILQTAGDKEYYFRQNTVGSNLHRHAPPDFDRYREETSPMMSCRLLPGDFLYLPRGTWHVAYPHTDSLSVSIGVFPASGG